MRQSLIWNFLLGSATAGIEVPVSNAWASHTFVRKRFLQLDDPTYGAHTTENLTLKAGNAYRFPFLFVVPRELLPQTCDHAHKHPEIRLRHLLLPPSLCSKVQLLDSQSSSDLGPDIASINYAIKFSVSQVRPATNKPTSLKDEEQRVYVLPTMPELPPILVSEKSKFFALSKATVVRSLRGRKLGTFSATAHQPSAIQLCKGKYLPLKPQSTMLKVDLRYIPMIHDQPLPVLKTVQTKLNAVTCFGTEPWMELPDQVNRTYSNSRHRSFCEDIQLVLLSITSVRWQKDQQRPASVEEQTRGTEGNGFVETGLERLEPSTASITLPIVLPEDKIYTPTFSSCLISRFYSIRVVISFDFHRFIPFSSTLSLTIPVQICSGSSAAADLAHSQNPS